MTFLIVQNQELNPAVCVGISDSRGFKLDLTIKPLECRDTDSVSVVGKKN